MISAEDLSNRFHYHPPKSKAVIDAHGFARGACFRAASTIIANSPACREQSLAVTKLEEASFWANAAIARNHDHYDAVEEPTLADELNKRLVDGMGGEAPEPATA